MSNSEINFNFVSPEHLNEKLSSVLFDDTWSHIQKCTKFFSQIISSNGRDSFPATVAVYNSLKKLTAIVSSRDVQGREELYSSIAEMLFLPVSIRSSLFILLTDTNVRDPDTGDVKSEAFNLSFVSPDFCIIYTIPYIIENDNSVIFNYDDSFVSSILTNEPNAGQAQGDLIELLFIFSHVENNGPFTFEEVLAYFDSNNFSYEIINRENLVNTRFSPIVNRKDL